MRNRVHTSVNTASAGAKAVTQTAAVHQNRRGNLGRS